MTFAFSDFFKESCRKQGFDWNTGWNDKFLEEFILEKDPNCPVSSKKSGIQKPNSIKNYYKRTEISRDQHILIVSNRQRNILMSLLGVFKSNKIPVVVPIPFKKDYLTLAADKCNPRIVITDKQYIEIVEEWKEEYNRNIKVFEFDALYNDLKNKDIKTLEPISLGVFKYQQNDNQSVMVNLLENMQQLLSEINDYFLTEVNNIFLDILSGKTINDQSIINAEENVLSLKIKNLLKDRLPEYMIPAYFIELDMLPLTKNNKIDYKSLPEVSCVVDHDIVQPTNEDEKVLLEVFKDLLGLKHMGIENNFFEFGFDSIKAIQYSSRLLEKDIKVDVTQILQYPTIKALAPLIIREEIKIDQSPVTGIIPLTPIQHWFFNNISSNQYSQSVLLSMETKISSEEIKKVFHKLVFHHDMLRISFRNKNGVEQYIREVNKIHFEIEEFDLTDQQYSLDKILNDIQNIQRNMKLYDDNLFKLALFHFNEKSLLFISVHHLIIDLVSWSILLEDAEILYHQILNNNELILAPKTNSFKLWSEKLHKEARSDKFLKYKDYWLNLKADEFDLKVNYSSTDSDLYEHTEIGTINLSKEETKKLLNENDKQIRVSVVDQLLTAIGKSFFELYGVGNLGIYLESHGREDIFENFNINRTIGWFTSIYPYIITYSASQTLIDNLIQVKESRSKLASNEISFGVLRYLNNDHILGNKYIKPKISFNYLGNMDRVSGKHFTIESTDIGENVCSTSIRPFILEFIAMVTNGKLNFIIKYSRLRFNSETIQNLLTFIRNNIYQIIDCCENLEEEVTTPSDFDYKELSFEQLNNLLG